MKIFLLVCLLAVALSEDPLRSVLKSPEATLNLYKQYKVKNHLHFRRSEDSLRFRQFFRTAQHVADYNEDTIDSAVYGLNFFSTMTPAEKKQYLGLNVTGIAKGPEDNLLRSRPNAPEKVLWTNTGDVTPVKSQGGCGSCWTFGAVGGLETRYKQLSGVLRNFAEQEYLDCVYEGSRDGCNGGWMDDCFDWSKNNGGRLAKTADFPYTESDGSCKSRRTPNAMKAYKITGTVSISRSEAAHIEAMVSGSISVAFEVTDKFFQYDGSIMRDDTCSGSANHAVTMVGYTGSFILVKNSWGAGWGDAGYVKFTRNYHNCHLYDYSSYPRLASTGGSDSGSDPATNYKPDESDDGPSPNPDPDCKDVNSDCAQWKNYCASNGWVDYMKQYCAKTCNYCEGGDGGDCPSGTVRCPDGVCRHEHMC
jgi:cathepsin K